MALPTASAHGLYDRNEAMPDIPQFFVCNKEKQQEERRKDGVGWPLAPGGIIQVSNLGLSSFQ
jgi:hypothetical protein